VGPWWQRLWRCFFFFVAPSSWRFSIDPFMLLDDGSYISASLNNNIFFLGFVFYQWFLATWFFFRFHVVLLTLGNVVGRWVPYVRTINVFFLGLFLPLIFGYLIFLVPYCYCLVNVEGCCWLMVLNVYNKHFFGLLFTLLSSY
jgi:hypothetical protein